MKKQTHVEVDESMVDERMYRRDEVLIRLEVRRLRRLRSIPLPLQPERGRVLDLTSQIAAHAKR